MIATAPSAERQCERPPTEPGERGRRLAVTWARARLDPLDYLRFYVRTLDQHDQENPIKAFPWERPHIQALVRLWQAEQRIVVCKSRQMLCTWLFCALALWDAMFHPGRLIMLQARREDDAIGDEVAGDGLLGRAKFILSHTPCGDQVLPRYETTAARIHFPDHNSALWAIPQGMHVIRQRTASGILSDEAAFQEDFGDAYTAALPCVRGGGWFLAVSTAHPGFFDKLRLDQV